MPNKHPLMSLSRDEELFLRHWMYDEVHYAERLGSAKQMQLEHRASPADLAVLIAAGIWDPVDQEACGLGPPPSQEPTWPWPGDALSTRLVAARAALAHVEPEPTPHPGEPRVRVESVRAEST
jgi:hypothetical protein